MQKGARKWIEYYWNYVNSDKYKEEKKQSENFKKLCNLIYFMKENVERFPKVKEFLWTLSSRNMNGKRYNVAKKEELEDQIKLVNSFLKLAYWY